MVLQKWWRRKIRAGGKEGIKFLGHAFALRIQLCWRHYQAKSFLEEFRRKDWERRNEALRNNAAICIQNNFKIHKAKQHVISLRKDIHRNQEERRRLKAMALQEDVLTLELPNLGEMLPRFGGFFRRTSSKYMGEKYDSDSANLRYSQTNQDRRSNGSLTTRYVSPDTNAMQRNQQQQMAKEGRSSFQQRGFSSPSVQESAFSNDWTESKHPATAQEDANKLIVPERSSEADFSKLGIDSRVYGLKSSPQKPNQNIRRPTASRPSLKINITLVKRGMRRVSTALNPFQRMHESRAAILLQCAWRRRTANNEIKRRRIHLARLKKIRTVQSAIQLQRLWRGFTSRRNNQDRWQLRAIKIIQRSWRLRRERSILKYISIYRPATMLIQRRWRGYRGRRSVRHKKERSEFLFGVVQKIQRIGRGYVTRLRVRKVRSIRRRIAERTELGRVQVHNALLVEEGRIILRGAYASRPHGVLYDYFHTYCTSDGDGLLVELTNAKFMKMIRTASNGRLLVARKTSSVSSSSSDATFSSESQHFAKFNHLTRADIDIVFSKVKQPDRQTLTFSEFIRALIQLAELMFGCPPKTRRPRKSRRNGNVTGINSPNPKAHPGKQYVVKLRQTKAEEQTNSPKNEGPKPTFLFRGFPDDDGRLVKFVVEHLTIGKRGSTEKMMAISLRRRLSKRMQRAANVIQRCFRGSLGRKRFAWHRLTGQKHKQEIALRQAVQVVQRLWRARKGLKATVQLMQSVVKKYVDPASGLPYWYNPKSGAVTWKKPTLLGDKDVDDTIVLPDRNLEWTVLCGKCNILSANFSCNALSTHFGCPSFFCESCLQGEKIFEEVEKAKIQLCVECGYQIASRRCEQCSDDYCDSCFASKHRRGRLMHHSWLPHVQMCEYCYPAVTATSARVTSYIDGRSTCKQCFQNHTGQEAIIGVNCAEYPLYTDGMKKIDDKRAKKREIAAKERAKLFQDMQARRNREIKAAIRLQAAWRMRKSFIEHGGYLDNARVARILLERQRKRDQKIKVSCVYQINIRVTRCFLTKTHRRIRHFTNFKLYWAPLPSWQQTAKKRKLLKSNSWRNQDLRPSLLHSCPILK